MNTELKPFRGLRPFFSLPALFVSSLSAFLVLDIAPALWPSLPSLTNFTILLEGIITTQLIMAWFAAHGRFPAGQALLLTALFALRLSYRSYLDPDAAWGLRSGNVQNPVLGVLWFGLGTLALHPSVYAYVRQRCQAGFAWNRTTRNLALGGWLLLWAFLSWAMLSKNISRDGHDWILRTAKPEWTHYLREPFTIGLYRLTYLLGQTVMDWSTDQTIALLSILAGVWGFYWYHRILLEMYPDLFSRILGWSAALASGGMMVLFFGHIEVYPIFIATLLPTFYLVQRYFQGKIGILFPAGAFSIAFLFHLSAGWLLPAFILLPFFYGYGGNVLYLLSVLYENFFVGQDHAMFLPAWAIFHPLHLRDLLNEYIYLSAAGFFLFPFAVLVLMRKYNGEGWFYFISVCGYAAYTLLWNPDRGFPEDWDLFSAIVPLLILFELRVLVRGESLGSAGPPVPDQRAKFVEAGREWVYIAALGTLPFSCSQIWYHHTVPFMMGD